MAEQAHHFRQYSPEQVPYGIERYTNEVNRLYGVMNRRLADRDFLTGAYSIADMACIEWVNLYECQGQDLNDFPHLKLWFKTMMSRFVVQRGLAVGAEERTRMNLVINKGVQAMLFAQRAL